MTRIEGGFAPLKTPTPLCGSSPVLRSFADKMTTLPLTTVFGHGVIYNERKEKRKCPGSAGTLRGRTRRGNSMSEQAYAVVGYIRVSTSEQADSGAGLESAARCDQQERSEARDLGSVAFRCREGREGVQS